MKSVDNRVGKALPLKKRRSRHHYESSLGDLKQQLYSCYVSSQNNLPAQPFQGSGRLRNGNGGGFDFTSFISRKTNSQNASGTLKVVWTEGLSRFFTGASQSNCPSRCVWQGTSTPFEVFDCLVSSSVLKHRLKTDNDTRLFRNEKHFYSSL